MSSLICFLSGPARFVWFFVILLALYLFSFYLLPLIWRKKAGGDTSNKQGRISLSDESSPKNQMRKMNPKGSPQD